MRTVIIRLTVTLIAIGVGVVIVWGLTTMGDKSAGPVEDFMTNVSTGVSTVENHFILQTREHTRSESLQWFDAYRNSKKKISHPDRMLWGTYDNEVTKTYQSVVELEDTLHAKFSIIQLYTAWGSKPDEKFPITAAKGILDIGSMPLITWEPWLIDFDKEKHPELPDPESRDKDGMKAVAKGDYDFYIDKWASDAKKLDRLIFVRLGHEMNDPYRYSWGPQNNKPEDFIAAWKHVVDRFREIGAKNVIWVWCPHPAYGYFDAYYPGADYVDWVGVGALNYGIVASWSKWWSFDDIFGKYYESLSHYKKPIMITEFGSLAVGGDREQWFKDAITSMPKKYPAIKSVVFYHNSHDQTIMAKSLDWYVKNDLKLVKTIRAALKQVE